MSKRNLTLLIIGLIAIVIIAFGFLYFYSPASKLGNGTTGTNFLSNLLPFGKSKTTTEATPPANVSGYVPETTTEAPLVVKLAKVSTMPVAGFGVFMKERFVEMATIIPQGITIPTENPTTGSSTATTPTKEIKPTPPPTEFIPALRYVDRTTGNIYETFADNIDERKFTTNIIPEVYDAYFGNNGESVAMRYLNRDGKTVETFIGAMPKETLGADTMTNEIKGYFLPENISNINIAPDTTKLFYLFNIGNNESSVGITANSVGDKKIQVFSSPFTEWLSWWPNNRMITLTTKPSANVPGYMYAIDPDKKTVNKILGNINGLTTLTSPSGKLVLYSNNNLSLSVYNVDTKETNSLGVKTLPEKCVWGKLNDFVYCAVPKSIEKTGYPDIWYQGEVSFTDEIWRINIADGSTFLISDPTNEKGENVDGIKLAMDENENYLFFVNKKDSYLWELNLQ